MVETSNRRRTRSASSAASGSSRRSSPRRKSSDASTPKKSKKKSGGKLRSAVKSAVSSMRKAASRVVSAAKGKTANAKKETVVGKKRKASSQEAALGDDEAPGKAGTSVNVHRCAFSEWTPEGIETFAAHPHAQMLALTRVGSGNIEVWEVEVLQTALLGKWRLSSLITGTGSSVVRSLVWAGGSPEKPDSYRLFGASVEGVVFEVDTINLELARCVESPGGNVWCLCAAPFPESRTIAAGCEDGTVRIFRVPERRPLVNAALRASSGTIEDDEIEYRKVLGVASRHDDERETRVLAATWHPSDPRTLFSSGADGIIRKWDMRISRDVMQIKIDGYGSARSTVVWALAALSDATVVSGDEHGHVNFWDTKTGTLIKSFREHRSDVLALTVSPSEDAVFASGIDSRIAMMRLRKESGEWVYTYSHRPHTHDVRALAVLPCSLIMKDGSSSPAPLIVSGGLDTKLISLPVNDFRLSRPYKVAPFPQRSIVSVASRADGSFLVLVQQQRCLQLWRVAGGAHTHLAKLQFSSHRILRCASMSRDGRWIACADAGGVKLLSINEDLDAAPASLLQRHMLDMELGGLSTAMRFIGPVGKGSACRLAVAQQSGDVFVVDVSVEGGALVQRQAARLSCAAANPFFTLRANVDATKLACADADGRISVFDVRKKTLDLTLETGKMFGATCTAFEFHPEDTDLLVIACSNLKFFLYYVDAHGGRLSDWSQHNMTKMPSQLLCKRDPIVGISFIPSVPDKFMLWSHEFMCVVSLNASARTSFTPVRVKKNARKRARIERAAQDYDSSDDEDAADPRNAKTLSPSGKKIASEKKRPAKPSKMVSFFNTYKPLIHAEFLSKDELVVVNLNWMKMNAKLPGVLKRKKYGT